MKIVIETIPHDQQRYPTCGDWWFDEDGTLQIRVSEMNSAPSEGAVAIHELVEVFLCSRGLTMSKDQREALVAEVDKFDKEYEGDLVDEEPGDDPHAPYHKEHSIATSVERILCAFLGVSWGEHDGKVAALFEDKK